eukprot:tig00001155_g7314.t1
MDPEGAPERPAKRTTRPSYRAEFEAAPAPPDAYGGDTGLQKAVLSTSSVAAVADDHMHDQPLGSSGRVPASLSPVAAAMAAGGSPFDALPDDLVAHIIGQASEISYKDPDALFDVSSSGFRTRSDQMLRDVVRISHVSRRFRSVARQPGLWERVIVSSPSDKLAEVLLRQSGEQREALRSLCLAISRRRQLQPQPQTELEASSSCSDADPHVESVVRLGRSFGGQLTRLYLNFDGDVNPAVLAAIQHCPRLEHLSISGDARAQYEDGPLRLHAHAHGNVQAPALLEPLVQGSLQALASLPLQSLALINLPITLETLQALAPLAPTLKRLRFTAVVSGAHQLPTVFSSIAVFQQLEQLKMGFFNEAGEHFTAEPFEADLQPLSSLSFLRSYYCTLLDHSHLGFLSGMRQLEFVSFVMPRAANISPLLSIPTLRGAILHVSPVADAINSAEIAAFTATASKLSALEYLALILPPEFYEALSGVSLKQWTRLRHLSLSCSNLHDDVIPVALLKRVASDVPSLELLDVRSPLALGSAGDFVAASSLKALPRLRRLAFEGGAAAALDATARGVLRAALLHAEVSFE